MSQLGANCTNVENISMIRKFKSISVRSILDTLSIVNILKKKRQVSNKLQYPIRCVGLYDETFKMSQLGAKCR